MKPIDSYRLTLGEGPGYDPELGLAWWFDIVEKKLFTRHLSEQKTLCYELPVAASAMAITKEGRQLLLAEDGFYFRDAVSGKLDFHLALEENNPITRSNDARVHPSGSFWVSTMGWNAEKGAGGIFLYRAGSVKKLMQDITVPNAICFSPDGSVAYFTDSAIGHIMRVAVDPSSGQPLGEPTIFIARDKIASMPAPTPNCVPDGAVTDKEGNLWVAIFGGSQVIGFSPLGERIAAIKVPATNVTCPAFVGKDARQMLITTARIGLADAVCAANPHEGASFVTEIDFTGRFDARLVT